jgi:hypothetical protein
MVRWISLGSAVKGIFGGEARASLVVVSGEWG